ncbi:SDR family oxidoreductase [Thalassotalea mangrovi]|uniref:SDR family oxidoreductase n=1 Tax=Thalassotalea mangrovi TaxID=2572245 RepID=A0A4U1B824_9GAMM|nr:SDR family oxidoreductase [Thalassotalea mangrovi]TKB46083.1 SDR family oxidoreductase [Thalassotalea mangrovi]
MLKSDPLSVVITGANRGIGLAMAEVFARRGDRVFAICRSSSEALNTLQNECDVTVVDGIDVATAEGITALQQALDNVVVDLLVNNAGILRDESLQNFNPEQIEQQFRVNALAPLSICQALQGNLRSGSKIALITSRMGSIADNGSGGRYGYRMSKAALNAAAMSLSKDLYHQGIAVGIYHPGYVQTDMVEGRGDISAQVAAQRLVGLMDDLSLLDSGVFRHSNGEVLPW